MAECIFCRIIAKEVPADIIHEDDVVMVFPDIEPVAPVHLLVIPKEHVPSLDELEDGELAHRMLRTAHQVGSRHGGELGYRVAINSAKQAEVGHVHFHVLGGLKPEDKFMKGGGTE